MKTSTRPRRSCLPCGRGRPLNTETMMSNQTTDPASTAISRNPATGTLIGTYPFQTADEIERMLVANETAFEQWRTTPLAERADRYRRLAATLRERSEALAMLATNEMGKTIGSARAEIEKCAATIAWIAEHGPAILTDELVETDTEDRAYVSFLPIGTVLAVMPWNFAFWQVIRAAGSIMLSGNGFVLKHAPNVMGCAYALRDAYEASGFPKHLFAILNAGKRRSRSGSRRASRMRGRSALPPSASSWSGRSPRRSRASMWRPCGR